MTLRQYLILMAIGTILCWVAWFFIISNVNPLETGYLGISFFYISLFLALTGTFSVIVFLIRHYFIKNNMVIFYHVRHTFRQGILISALITMALILLQEKLLTWWNGIILVILFVILESIIFTNRKYKNNDFKS